MTSLVDFTAWSPWSNLSDGKRYIRNRTCEENDGLTIKKVNSSNCNGSDVEAIGNNTENIFKSINEDQHAISSEAYLGSSEKYMMKLYAKINNR